MNAFLTGSRVYGDSEPDSDIDLVVMMDEKTLEKLRPLSDDMGMKSLRFGRLNLLICMTSKEYEVWQRGTSELINRANVNGPVMRMEAVELFRSLRQQADVISTYPDPEDTEEPTPEDVEI